MNQKTSAKILFKAKLKARKRVFGFAPLVTCALSGLIGTASAAQPVDFQIDTDAEYTRFVDAIRATEYVREDYIVQNRNPRIVASVAALSAYAQMNPLASASQLNEFVNAFDARVQADYPGDPNLRRSANLMTAVRFTVIDEPGLVGTDTHVGQLAADYLDIVVPAPDSFEATRQRMVRFGQGLAMRYTHHNGFAQLLVSGFYGISQGGSEIPGLSEALEQYLNGHGYTPGFGQVDSDARFEGVNTGISMLPTDIVEFTLVTNQSLVSNAMVLMVDAKTEIVQGEIDSRVATIGDSVLAEPAIEDSVAFGQDQGVIDQYIADLQAQLQETSEARSSMFGATLLLGQSPLDELGDYSVATIELNSSLLEASDTMAEVQLGLGVAANLATLTAGALSGDPVSAIGGVFGLVSNSIDIAGHAGASDNTPSVDEQVYAQLVELRMQIETMRAEMHGRFDRIESQLNFMYDQMVIGFNAVGNAIGDLGNQNQAILREMHIVRSQLSQLESALFGVAEDILLTDLTDAANTVLDYRDENNIDFAYANQNPSFVTASEDFFTYATTTAQSQAFSGSRDHPSVTLATAADYLDGSPVARYLNDLAVLPQSLGLAPLTFTTLAGPEPWAQASSAYVQLVKENPWYFAFRYESQVEDYLSDPENESLPELDHLIQTGEDLVHVGDSARNPALFDALVQRYKDQAQTLQNEINAVFHAEMVSQKLRAVMGKQISMIDLWTQDGNQFGVEALFPVYASGHVPALNQMRGMSPDWGTVLDVEPSLSYFQKATIASGDHVDHANRAVLFEYLSQLDANPSYVHEIRFDAYVPAPLARGLFARPPVFEVIHRVDTDPNPNVENMQQVSIRRVDSQMAVHGQSGGPVVLPINMYYNEEDPRSCAYPMFTAGGGRDVAWSNFEQAMPFGNIEGMDLQFTNTHTGDYEWADCADNWMFLDSVDYLRFQPWSDVSYVFNHDSLLTGHIHEMLTEYRDEIIRPMINASFADPISQISQAASELNHTVALINAYLTIAAPDAMRRSEVLRIALRAAPGQSEIGLRSHDVLAMVLDFQSQADARDPRSAADDSYDFHVINTILESRVDFLHEEINRALGLPLESAPYIEWMLAELNDARDQSFVHARDDSYVALGAILVDSSIGVLANDVLQEFRVVEVDLSSATQPSNGSLTLFPDGAFEYTPNAGFSGQDSFTYSLVGTIIDGLPDPVDGQFFTDHVTVVMTVESAGCSEVDFVEDGTHNFFDVSFFLQAFGNQEPVADLTGDGSWNFFDVSAFLLAFNAGCP